MRPQAIMNHHAKSFSWAARFLSPDARSDAALLYAFARTADDYADEDALGSLQDRLASLADLRSQVLNPVADAPATLASITGRMLRSHEVPRAVLFHFMDSLQADAGPRTIQTQQQLLRFAYGVAGTVGQMMRPVLGAPASADEYAIALGVAMQLTNIARDVVEDAQRGRCYIPAQWGVSARLMAAPNNAHERLQAFAAIERLLTLADDFYAHAHAGIGAIEASNQRAIRLATLLYQSIGHQIVKRGPELFWEGRCSLSTPYKLWLIARMLLAPVRPPRPSGRNVWRSDLAHLADTPGFPV